MATQFHGQATRRYGHPERSLYDFIPSGAVHGLFFRILLLVAPIQSVLVTPVQGSTAAFVLVFLSPVILAGPDPRYFRLLAFFAGFILLYALYMAFSLSGFLIDQPDMSRLTVIREVYVYGYLKQTHITQGLYLMAAMGFAFLIYTYFQEAFVKYAFYSIIILSLYGFYEFVFYAITETNGDFLSNRNFGDLDTAAAGAGRYLSTTGSRLQTSNLFGAGYMRLKSLTGEPSMYALSVTPFAVYALGRRWWPIFAILAISLLLSTSTTAVIGLLVGFVYVVIRHRPESVIYIAAALVIGVLLYTSSDLVRQVLDTLLFQKLDTVSGNERLQSMLAHAYVPFDGNPIRALFGLGFGTVRSADMFSNVLANIGVLGIVLYSALILTPCVLLRGSDRDALAAALLSIYVMEMTTVTEFGYLPPWFIIALGYARLRNEVNLSQLCDTRSIRGQSI